MRLGPRAEKFDQGAISKAISKAITIPSSGKTCPAQLKSSGRYVLLSCDDGRGTCLTGGDSTGRSKSKPYEPPPATVTPHKPLPSTTCHVL